MTLVEKLNLFNMSEEEKKRAIEKFLPTLALVDENELKELLEYLASQGVYITKAREIKIVSNSKDELGKKFSILGEVHENELYRQEPLMLNKNVIDIYKKIKYCTQNNKSYKKEDGSYETFLFSEMLWQQEFNNVPVQLEEPLVNNLDEELTTIEPTFADTLPNIEDIKSVDILSSNEPNEIETQTANFADIRKQLEEQLKEVDSLNINDVINFNDIDTTAWTGAAA